MDFRADVEPILKSRCISCHGAGSSDGGLRLDAASHIKKGGNSGQSLATADATVNELLARIVATDERYRMPRDADALTDDEIDVVRRWIVQGAELPADDATEADDQPSAETATGDEDDSWLRAWSRLIKGHRGLFYTLGVLMLGMLVVERWKIAFQKRAAWTTGRALNWSQRFSRIQPAQCVCAMLAMGLIIASAEVRARGLRLEESNAQNAVQVAELTTELEVLKNPSFDNVYGDPPVPHRPNHAVRLTNIYYRGNCERDPRLNNEGNYRTATFHVALCDADDRLIDPGDDVSGRPLFVRVEMERSPYTADALYSPRIMNTVFFSERSEKKLAGYEADPVQFQVLESEKRWVAYFPLGEAGVDGELTGLVYMLKSASNEPDAEVRPHYGVKYDLTFAGGRIKKGSDLWMGSLFWHEGLAGPQPGKVPLSEWFSHYPIPVMNSENIQDPTLLGVDDYIEQNTEPALASPNAN